MALGTTASWTGAFSPLPPPPPWLSPPPPDSLTCAPQAATRVMEAARSTARTCLLRIRSSFSFLYRRCMQRLYHSEAAAVLVPEDREPDHDANNDLLVEGVHVQKDRPVADQGYEEGPDQGAHHRSLPPEEARPADDGGRDHVELQPDAEVRLPRVDS